jgi:hypothetical protein
MGGVFRREAPAPPGRASLQEAAPPVRHLTVADAQVLLGRWVRTDSPYILEISSAAPDGSLEAVYLNPSRVNVSRAEFQPAAGTLEVFVELRDTNYPGSTYTLRYEVEDDVLQGVYFQAALRQSFDVVFARSGQR